MILAHNYQRAEVQDAADFVGDSLELARKAAATDAEVILFCGVHFMAETAKILSPGKTVLMPDKRAGCPMADMVTADGLRGAARRSIPDAVVVAYVNTTADGEGRGRRVLHQRQRARRSSGRFPADRQIIFVPDQHLGDWVRRQTGARHDPLARLLPHPRDHPARRHRGAARATHPGAKVMAHPECRREVLDLADVVTSTSGMLRYPESDDAPTYIVATEIGLLHRAAQAVSRARRSCRPSDCAVCPNMKLTTLDEGDRRAARGPQRDHRAAARSASGRCAPSSAWSSSGEATPCRVPTSPASGARPLQRRQFDVLVLGGGIAGLTAAISAARRWRVGLLTKAALRRHHHLPRPGRHRRRPRRVRLARTALPGHRQGRAPASATRTRCACSSTRGRTASASSWRSARASTASTARSCSASEGAHSVRARRARRRRRHRQRGLERPGRGGHDGQPRAALRGRVRHRPAHARRTLRRRPVAWTWTTASSRSTWPW